MSGLEDGRSDLAVVNEAYGHHTDLYAVLRVQPNAGAQQIQEAYFDRRNELFQLLADIDFASTDQDSITESHRKDAERKMDAVVCAVRILGDPNSRLQYDDLRADRMMVSPKRSSPGKSPPDLSYMSKRDTQQPQPECEISSSQSSTASDFSSRFSSSILNPICNPETTSKTYPKKKKKRFIHGDDVRNVIDDEPLQPPPAPSRTRGKIPPGRGVGVRPLPSVTTSKTTHHVPLVSPAPRPPAQGRPSEPASSKLLESRRNKKCLRSTTLSQHSLDDGDGSVSYATEGDEEDTLYTAFTVDDASVTPSVAQSIIPDTTGGLLERIRVEILGAVDDTTRSFEQVLNAFTLQQEDINAVMGRIDKAKRLIQKTYIFFPSAEENVAPLVTSSGRKSSSKKTTKSQTKATSKSSTKSASKNPRRPC